MDCGLFYQRHHNMPEAGERLVEKHVLRASEKRIEHVNLASKFLTETSIKSDR